MPALIAAYEGDTVGLVPVTSTTFAERSSLSYVKAAGGSAGGMHVCGAADLPSINIETRLVRLVSNHVFTSVEDTESAERTSSKYVVTTVRSANFRPASA